MVKSKENSDNYSYFKKLLLLWNREKNSILHFIFCLALFSIKLNAQSYSYRHYSPEDGVSSSTVYCAMQDSKGYMWFGTETGACRFDGKKFTQFTMDDGLSDNEIFQVHEDSKGRIWFLTFNGKLSFLENGIFHNPDNDIILKKAVASTNNLISFYQDNQDCIWIGTFENGLIKIDGQKVSHYDLSENTMDDKGMYVQEDSLNNVWGIKSYKSVKLDESLRRDSKKIPFSTNNQNFVYTQNGNLLFLNSDSNIYFVERMNFRKLIYLENKLYVNLIHNLYMDRLKNIWICTRGSGCHKYNFSDGSYEQTETFLPDKTVYSVFVDNENNTWITTAGEGIFMLPADYKNYYSYTINDGLSEAQINSMAKDRNGNIWLGLSNSKINVITKNELLVFAVNNKTIPYNRVICIYPDHNNSIWCATDNGLGIFKDNVWSTPLTIDVLATLALKSITANPVTNEISFTSSSGISRIIKEDFSLGYRAYFDTTFKSQRTFTHNYDHMGNLWIGNIEGLNFFDGKKLIKYGIQNRLLQSRITDIKEFVNGIMIVATYGHGIIFFRNGKIIQHINKQHELAGNICRQIFIRDSVIWIATNFGLSKIIYEKNSFIVKQNLNSTNGLISDNVTGVIDEGNKLYVATDKGLSVLNKNVSSRQTNPPPVYVTKVTTDNNFFNASGIPEISHKNQRIIVDFIAVTFKNPSEVKYQYRLNGMADKWTETTNNSVEFSSLTPGDYIFELKAKKIDSGWSKPVKLSFVISTPFWKTLWFRFLFISLGILYLFWVIRILTTRKLRHQLFLSKQKQAIEAERNRIASDMHDDLGADLTRISIWSNIVESETDNVSLIKQHNQRISSTADSLLKKMDEIIWTLNPVNDTLENLVTYLHKFILDFFEDTPVSCRVIINTDNIPSLTVSSVCRRNIFLAVKESLSNIIKHSDARSVEIELLVDGNTVKIIVTDDGKGFDVPGIKGNRHGIDNLKKRVHEIGGKIELTSETGKGTRVVISAPVQERV